MKTNIRSSKNQEGLTLIELLVAIFIFSLIAVAIVAVFVSATTAYQKARAIKLVKENAEFALNSIAKDIRMGKIESAHATGNRSDYFMVTRNRNQMKVCYEITSTSLGIKENATLADCSLEGGYDKIIDLAGTNMTFDPTSGFYSLTTDPPTSPTRRGWVEINLNISMASGQEMSADKINVQTIVSSRDYGWEEVP